MRARTARELGTVIRERRRELNLTQQQLADQAKVGRTWLVAVEAGHQRAELDKVLRVVAVLGLTLDVSPDVPAEVDLDAISDVATFGNEPAIVLERYDRIVLPDGEVTRVHQEDLCQALGVSPDRKYERDDGGPGASEIIALLREHQTPALADESVETFCRALAFNWAVYGPDAHAKNYSLLLAGPQVRLAPLYDIASVAAYPDQYKLNRAMMAISMENIAPSRPSIFGSGRSRRIAMNSLAERPRARLVDVALQADAQRRFGTLNSR
jgi:y4mF family transcriptional regulator